MTRLAAFAAIDSGSGFPIADQGVSDGEFPFLKVSDMNLPGNEIEIKCWNNSISSSVRDRLRAKAFPANTVIFPKIGAAIATNKKRLLTVPSCIDNNCMGVTGDPAHVEPWYLYYLFRTKNLSDFASDSNPPSIRKAAVESWDVRLPSKDEQRRIVDLLARAENILRMRREAEKKANEIIPALFLDMFGDPATNPRGWDPARIGDLAIRMSDGPFGSNLKSSHYVDSGVRVIRLQNIGVGRFLDSDQAFVSHEHFAKLQKHKCVPGDVLIGTMGDPNLRAMILPERISEALNKADCVQLRCDPAKATPTFVCWLLNMPGTLSLAAQHVRGITRSRISMGRLREVNVSVPPLELQQRFTGLVERLDVMQESQREGAKRADQSFRSLLAGVFGDKCSTRHDASGS